MYDELGIVIAVIVSAGGALGCFLFWYFHFHSRGSSALRARREQAFLHGAVSPGVPFELAGVVPSTQRVALHFDMNVHVLGGADVEISFRSCGVRLAFEIDTDGTRAASGDAKQPPDETRLGPEVRATDTMFPSQRTRVVCSIPIEALSVAAGQRVMVRGLMTPLPNNEVHAAALWLG